MFSGLKNKLAHFINGRARSIKDETISDEDRERFNSLTPSEQADVLVQGSAMPRAEKIAALLELGHTAEARTLQAGLKPIVSASPAPVAKPATAVPVAQSTSAAVVPKVTAQAVTPSAAIVAPAAVSTPPSVTEAHAARAKTTAAIAEQIATAESRKAQQAAALAEKETARKAAQDQLCHMVIEFDGLRSQEARSAFWLLNREKIEALSAVETIKGNGWIGGFLRRH